MTILCLNYLMYEVAGEPLSGSPSLNVNRNLVSKKYPLLLYIARHWPHHACQSLQVFEDLDEADARAIFKQKCFAALIDTLSKFIERNSLLTVWIEAAWTSSSPPSILDLLSKVSKHTEYCFPISRKETLILSETLKRLASTLLRLNEDWHHVLSSEPCEIWQPSIIAFLGSEFLVGTTKAQVTSLFSKNDEEGSVMIASQVSTDGEEVGIIKVWPSRYTTGARDQHSTEDWKVAYQIWSLSSKKQVTGFCFLVPQNHILGARAGVSSTMMPRDFRFPVAFSSSLRLAIILNTVIQISDAEIGEVTHHCEAQKLFAIGCQNGKAYDALLGKIHVPRFGPRFSSNLNGPGIHYDHTKQHPFCHDWTRSYFHPSERYLAILNGSGPPHLTREVYPKYVLDIYENDGSPKTPSFQLIGSVGLQSYISAAQFSCFHPFKPVLAISLLSITVIWQFTERESPLSQIHSKPLNNLTFSNCGNFLHGMTRSGDPVLVPISMRVIPMIQSSADSSSASDYSQQLVPGVPTQERDLIQLATSSIQNSGVPEFSVARGQMQMSMVTQHDDLGTITRQTMSADGTLTNEAITRIPRFSTLEQSYSTLVPTEIPDNVRIVLNLAAQESYSPIDVSDFQLPAVIDRKIHTIPVYISSTNQRQIGCSDGSTRKRITSSSEIRCETERSIAKRPRAR